jgi:predicted TIM-barrel enzyme
MFKKSIFKKPIIGIVHFKPLPSSPENVRARFYC